MSASVNRSRTIVVSTIIGVLALGGCAAIGRQAPQQAMLSYLSAYLFFLAPALGSMALLMMHALTGGRWGHELRPELIAATRTLALLAIGLLPLLAGARWLYPWMRVSPAHAATLLGAHLAQQRWYLDAPFFTARAIGCFTLWLWFAHGLRRRLRDPRCVAALPRFAALGLLTWLFTASVAAFDWIMSLVPAWHSSVLGLTFATSQLVCAGAAAVVFAAARDAIPPARLRDLGSLLMAMTLGWSYLVYMDYLTAWIADLPSETVWYLPRLATSWCWIGLSLIVLHLLLPFAVLVSRRAKQQRAWLRGAAASLLLAQALFMLWLVAPDFRAQGFALTWCDALAWIGIGAPCIGCFVGALAGERARAEAIP